MKELKPRKQSIAEQVDDLTQLGRDLGEEDRLNLTDWSDHEGLTPHRKKRKK